MWGSRPLYLNHGYNHTAAISQVLKQTSWTKEQFFKALCQRYLSTKKKEKEEKKTSKSFHVV